MKEAKRIMKHIIVRTLPVLVLGLAFAGCEKDLDTYQGASGIYFDHEENQNILRVDTLPFQWGQIDGDIKEETIELRINLIGNVVDYDRPFQVTVVPSDDPEAAVEGTDYKAFDGNCMIPANESYTTLRITLLRTEALQTEQRMLTVQLNATDELQFLYSREAVDRNDNTLRRQIDLQRVIVMDETLPAPSWWYGSRIRNIFGDYSMKKAITICNVMNIDRKEWLDNEFGDREAYLIFVGQYMHRWLQEQNPPIYEEDGETLMEMGPDSQV